MLAVLNLQTAPLDNPVPERRRDRRADTWCNALIRLNTALTFRCVVRNLSMAAAQVLCEARYALLVHPSRTFEISIAFPVDGAVRGFTAQCRAKYCEPLTGNTAGDAVGMVMGLGFAELEPGTRQLLAAYLGTLDE